MRTLRRIAANRLNAQRPQRLLGRLPGEPSQRLPPLPERPGRSLCPQRHPHPRRVNAAALCAQGRVTECPKMGLGSFGNTAGAQKGYVLPKGRQSTPESQSQFRPTPIGSTNNWVRSVVSTDPYPIAFRQTGRPDARPKRIEHRCGTPSRGLYRCSRGNQRRPGGPG